MSMTNISPMRLEELAATATSEVEPNSLSVHPLTNEHQQEVLAFLAERPLHTVIMSGQSPRRVCRELLLEQRWPVEALEPVPNLRLASLAELQDVMLVQGEMAFQESGINPMEVDLAGFSLRCSRRIEQGRVWVWMEDGRLIFKADVISDTPEVIYMEGIYVNPQERERGYGARCMSQLARVLLQRTDSLSMLVNEQSHRASAFFDRRG